MFKKSTVQSLKTSFTSMLNELKLIQEKETVNVEKAEAEKQRATTELAEASRFRAKLEEMVS